MEKDLHESDAVLTDDPIRRRGEQPFQPSSAPLSQEVPTSSSAYPPPPPPAPSASTTAGPTAESTSQLLKGFWKKTVDNTATAHALWTHRLLQQRSNSGGGIGVGGSTGGAGGVAASFGRATVPPNHNRTPLIHIEQASLSPATSPANHDAAGATATATQTQLSTTHADDAIENEIVMVREEDDNDVSLGQPTEVPDLLGSLHHSDNTPTDPSLTVVAAHDEVGEAGTGRRSHAPTSGSSDGADSREDYHDEDDDNEDDSNDSNDDDDADTASYVSSSAYSTSHYGSDTNRLSALQWAAASVVDSVQSGYFRGRYASSASQQTKQGGRGSTGAVRGLRAALPTRGSVGGVSQTSRILGSAHGAHLRDLLAKLGPHEYLMFLGKGMLGVNLKQSYLHKVGVYVDFLIPDGAADKSNLIRVGDLLTHVGDADVRRHTILTVPQQIAAAPRPLHLVWATGALPGIDRLDYVEMAVAHLQRWRDDTPLPRLPAREREGSLGNASVASTSPPASPSRHPQALPPVEVQESDHLPVDDGAHDAEEKKHESPLADAQSEPECDSAKTHPEVMIPVLGTLDELFNPDLPPLEAREAYHDHSAGRNTGVSVLHLCQQAATDENFRNLLQHAFVLCAVDDRRLVFLSRHLGQQEEEDDRPFNSPSALLALFVEMINFADLYSLTPPPRRKHIANLIAHKFFLPTRLGHELVPPMFDFHQIVPDAALRSLEAALKAETVPRDLFSDFCFAALESLASHPFLTFLVSPECSRMRAYLRHIALFVRVPFQNVLKALAPDSGGAIEDSPDARNYFSHVLLYLLCRTDREGYGEHDDVLATGNGARCQDAAGSLCAALFVRHRLAGAVERARLQIRSVPDGSDTAILDGGDSGTDDDPRTAVVAAWERLWEVFVAPYVGALALAPLSNEAAAYHSQLVADLRQIQIDGGGFDVVAGKLCDEELLRTAMQLADEIIYCYSVNLHPKFREHKFHEWLCAEQTQVRQLQESIVTVAEVPHLPAGCVKRLLQKATFPVGIAPHKPFVQAETTHEGPNVASHAEQVSAECAVVFGTPVGLFDSNPALMDGSHDALRRYASELMYSGDPPDQNALTLEDVPPTLESYAVVPSLMESAPRPFKHYRDGQWLRYVKPSNGQ